MVALLECCYRVAHLWQIMWNKQKLEVSWQMQSVYSTVRTSVLPASKKYHVALVIDWQWGRLDLTQESESMFCLSILETLNYIQMHVDFCNESCVFLCVYTFLCTQKYRVFTLPLIVVQKSVHHLVDNRSEKNPSDAVDRIRNTFSNWHGMLMAGRNPVPPWTLHV